MNKTIILLLSFFLISTNSSALNIYNNNTKSIRVEIMDCPSKLLYSFPTSWKSNFYNENPLLHIDFLHINHVLPNGTVYIDQHQNPDMPSNVCIHIQGWSSWFGGVITKVRHTCDMTIHDGGFLQGITAQYHSGC